MGRKHKIVLGSAAAVTLVAVIAAAVLLLRSRPVNIWCVTMVPMMETTAFQQKLAQRLEHTPGDRQVVFESRSALGNADELVSIFAAADRGKADVLVVQGLDVALLAREHVEKTPVVFCGVPWPKAYDLDRPAADGATFVGLLDEPPVERYCSLLRQFRPEWGDAGIILPEGYLAGGAEADAFEEAYSRTFGSKTKRMVIDARTCAQLEDVVEAYNTIMRHKVDLYYAISDGNLAKYLYMLVGQCTRHGIPVIGGGAAVVEQGGVLALVPDQESLVDQCAALVEKVLAGQPVSHERVREYRVIRNTGSLERLEFSLDGVALE